MKSIKKSTCLVVVALICGAFCAPACLANFTGSLSIADGGLDGEGGWSTGTSLEWTVTPITGGWNYYYKLTVTTVPSISHMIIETSNPFALENDFSNLNVTTGDIGSLSVAMWDDTNPSNPYMPEDVYGIKFDDTSGLVLEFDFDSRRVPVWGDFYAKGGSGDAVWNTGFDIADPLVGPHDGSESYHILRPDSIIPAPGAILLGAIGVGLVGWLRKRRMI